MEEDFMRLTKTLLTVLMGIAVVAGISGTCEAKEYRYINIATASMGGTFYPLGGGMADVLSKELPQVIG